MSVILAIRCDGCGTLAHRSDTDDWAVWQEPFETPVGEDDTFSKHHCPDCKEADD